MLLKKLSSSKPKEYRYIEKGKGKTIVLLHGLMGGLSNFGNTIDFLSTKGYRVIIPELPIYEMPLISTNVKNIAKFLLKFLDYKKIESTMLLGNSLGGHVALLFAKLYPNKISHLILTGSSGLYESAMGGTYPRRGDYEFVRKKTEEVFYDPKMVTAELLDEVFEVINNRNKIIRTLAIAKSAIRHNMASDLPNIKIPACIIWGKNDSVTPPDVAEEFHKLLPNSTLYWIDKCGHAPMMERPEEFNNLLLEWLSKYK